MYIMHCLIAESKQLIVGSTTNLIVAISVINIQGAVNKLSNAEIVMPPPIHL